MSSVAGIGSKGRAELAAVVGRGRRFVTPSDVADALGIDRDSAAKRLARWASDGWLRRARRGLYIPVPVDADNPAAWSEDAFIVAEAIWSPCYFTGWTAANHWALTDQVFRSTVLKTENRVRVSSTRVLDHDYLITHVDPEATTWGLKTLWKSEVRLRVADPARTVIDILDAPRLAGGIRHGAEILRTYLDENDTGPLIEYGERLANRAVFKRLGYLAETLGGVEPLVSACRTRISSGISVLDPEGPDGGRRLMRWNLRINVRVEPEDSA
jgi:predicted transcriptional regulator of viral defense system